MDVTMLDAGELAEVALLGLVSVEEAAALVFDAVDMTVSEAEELMLLVPSDVVEMV